MSDGVCEKNLAGYRVAHFSEDDSRFCLAQVGAYEAEDPAAQQKIEDLLEGRITTRSKTMIERACNIGGCTLKVAENLKTGREIIGQCKAASYCLKVAFAAVGKASTVEEGKALYGDIMDTLEGRADKYNAGNFCPRLNCGFSAGVSIDMVPGTYGDCIAEITQDQQQLEFDRSR